MKLKHKSNAALTRRIWTSVIPKWFEHNPKCAWSVRVLLIHCQVSADNGVQVENSSMHRNDYSYNIEAKIIFLFCDSLKSLVNSYVYLPS